MPRSLEPEWLTLHQVAELTGFSYRTIWKKVKSKELPGQQVGRQWRVRVVDYDAWMTRN